MKHKLRIWPDNLEMEIDENTDLLTAVSESGLKIRASCAGRGICGKCKVIIKDGNYVTEGTHLLTDIEKKKNYVLACRTKAAGDLVIEIPLQYEDVFTPAERVERSPGRPEEGIFKYDPLVKKIFLQLEEPNLTNTTADLERLIHKLESSVEVDYSLLYGLEKVLRDSNWNVTITLVDYDIYSKIIRIEPGDKTGINYGIALDIGTTTVVAYLVDLNTGGILNAKASYNNQITFGEDVITRMIYAQEKNGLDRLNNAIRETINNLINNIAKEENILLSDIYAIQCAGNTTMTHMFFNIPTHNIRKEPYVPAFNQCPPLKSSEIGLNINPKGVVSCTPNVASYVGGDITAGVLACGMDNFSTISLLIDLGTNGEIVLGNRDWLICCACSAGPAFEGVGIKCGMHALKGAIQRIEISNDKDKVKYNTVGNKRPKGICGSGLLDIPAELLKKGIISRAGKFITDGSPLVRRNGSENEYEFVIVPSKESETGDDIVITESDIANLIRSKGAVFLGIQILLNYAGLKYENINHVYLSGGFGTYIDIEKAIIIGLLPDLPKDKFSFIGNSSITGAKICLLSKEARIKVKNIAQKMTYIELSTDPVFMNDYTSTLFLPHTNLELFPSVKNMFNAKG